MPLFSSTIRRIGELSYSASPSASVKQKMHWSITWKLLMISTWNLEYIFTIKFYIITNKTHNSATNIFQAMFLFFVYFAISKIWILPITLKLLEILPWNLKYIFTIKIFIITNNTHNHASNIFFKLCHFSLTFCVKQNIHLALNFKTYWAITLKLGKYIHLQNLCHYQQDP
jgi:hypothetical protein